MKRIFSLWAASTLHVSESPHCPHDKQENALGHSVVWSIISLGMFRALPFSIACFIISPPQKACTGFSPQEANRSFAFPVSRKPYHLRYVLAYRWCVGYFITENEKAKNPRSMVSDRTFWVKMLKLLWDCSVQLISQSFACGLCDGFLMDLRLRTVCIEENVFSVIDTRAGESDWK